MKFRQATLDDFPAAARIIAGAVVRMLALGRRQWSADYPTDSHIFDDIAGERAYVMTDDSTGRVVAYGAVCYDGEPAYDRLDGEWLTDSAHYVVVHRLAVATDCTGRGIARMFLSAVDRMAAARGIGSFRIDTNHDNAEMLALLDRLGFDRCGTVSYPQGQRIAFEKRI